MTDTDDLPRVLILCDEPINRIGGGGVTMGSLFSGWPVDRLAQVWAHHRFEIDTDVCPHYLRLGAHSIPGASYVPKALKQQRDLVKRLRVLVRPGVRLDYAQVLNWARLFRPDVIYSQATPYPMYTWWLPRWLARDLAVPLVNHIMDDWPAAAEAEWFPPLRLVLRPFLRGQLRALFGAAVCNLAISQQMADAFARRYGQAFIPFHNAVDLAQWASAKSDYRVSGPTFRVVYLGALAENMQLLSLQDVARVISDLAARGTPISLTVYTGAIFLDYFQQYLASLSAVSHGGTVAREDLCARLAEADLLVLPVNFDPRSALMNRYSMPTKVPEYMASGAPILVYGPSHVPPVEYGQRAGWGYVVDRQAPDLLRAALVELMASEPLRARLGRRGRELAVSDHDARAVRGRFRAVLSAAAQSGAARAAIQVVPKSMSSRSRLQ